MIDPFYRGLSLYVGWFNIVVSIGAPIYFAVVSPFSHNEFHFDVQNYRFKEFLAVTLGFTPWCILSILLVNGIKENRPKLISLWMNGTYLLLIIAASAGFAYICTVTSWFEAKWNLLSISPIIALAVILLLFTIPVRKVYNQMSCTPIEEPKISLEMEEKKSEDDKRYIPIFENV